MELREFWKSDFRADVHRKMWDDAAEDYVQRPLPNPQRDEFLQRMLRHGCLHKDARVLDIGCGAGAYTLALAPYIGQGLGCDLSEKMIRGASERAASMGLDNVSFTCLDWHRADPARLGWEGAFDVVFAHHTPAVSDYDTFDKMVRCAGKTCFFQVNTRRWDAVLNAALERIGIYPAPQERDNTVAWAFAYLWQHGLEPNIAYHKETWIAEKPLEKQFRWVLQRAKLRREITPEEADILMRYLAGLAENGTVRETITTTVVTMDWDSQ